MRVVAAFGMHASNCATDDAQQPVGADENAAVGSAVSATQPGFQVLFIDLVDLPRQRCLEDIER